MATYTYQVETDKKVPLDIYRFFITPIREADVQVGREFLKRWLLGPQDVWKTTFRKAQSIPLLWSIEDCPDDLLVFLKRIVGWTPSLDKISGTLEGDALRRLIGVSARLWKTRGPEQAILDILRLFTGARSRVWNWFDFRWVLDETELGEEHAGRDPWVVDLPYAAESLIQSGINLSSVDGVNINLGAGSFSLAIANGMTLRLKSGPFNGEVAKVLARTGATTLTLIAPGLPFPFAASSWEVVTTPVPTDHYRSNLRIVDDGTLDRTLVKRILRLMRALGERIEITYLAFLDLFSVAGDNTQWSVASGLSLRVENGTLIIDDDTQPEATNTLALSVGECAVAVRLKGHSNASGARFGFRFFYTSATNYYEVALDTADQTIRLRKNVNGTISTLAILSFPSISMTLLADVYYTIRATSVVQGSNNRIVIFLDGAILIDAVDNIASGHSSGGVGLFHNANAILVCDEVEVLALPVDVETLDINEDP